MMLKAWISLYAFCFSVSGGLNVLRDIIPEFLSNQKCRLSKLKRFARSLCEKNDGHQVRALDSRALLIRYITKWTENAHTHQLRALPNVLRRSGLQSTARKINEILIQIEEKVSVCQNGIGSKEWAISYLEYSTCCSSWCLYPGVLLKLLLLLPQFRWNSFSSMTHSHKNSGYCSVLHNSSRPFD